MDLSLQTQPCNMANSCWVMRSNTVYAIYWIPSGATACGGAPCQVSANYISLINQYFTDVAAASGSSSNVYSADTQYYDATGPIAYQSAFAGSYVDQSSFPANGCSDGVDPICLTDQQIENEIQNVLTTNNWHGSTTTMFFVMTPDGVGSCFDSSDSQCTTNTYCAYHTGFFDTNNEPVIYANEPYDATIPGCDSGSSPNGDDADTELNTISHEHNEAITDPAGTAWWTSDPDPNFFGMEIGDLCAWDFGPALGSTANGDFNQVINGHDYWLQQEYSNDGSACAQRYPFEVPVNTTSPTVSGVAGEGHLLSAAQGVWSQVPTSYTYQWLRCSSASDISCFPFPGDTGATYRLTANDVGKILRVGVYATNAVGSSIIAESAPTSVVVPVPFPASPPVVSGTTIVGKTLSTTAGAWNASASFAYQWQRCNTSGIGCNAISGATSATYVLGTADLGHKLEAVVTATNPAGTASASSTATPIVIEAPHATRAPRISGTPKIGKRLTTGRGTWAGPPATYKYAWLRCSRSGAKCIPIKKATHASYLVTGRDAGHRLRVRVTGINLAGSRAATSSATKRVPAARKH